MRFYNPRISTITLGVSIFKGTVQVAIARALDPNFQGQPSKGQKVYDWENTSFFSLSPDECYRIMTSLTDIVSLKYVNKKEKDPKYANVFSITHFQDKHPSRFIIDGTRSQQGTPTGSIVMTIIPPPGKGSTAMYVFRPDELERFKFYIGNGAKYLDFIKDVYDGIERIKNYKGKDSSETETYQSKKAPANTSRPTPNNYNNTNSTLTNTLTNEANPWDAPPTQSQPDSNENSFDSMDDFNLSF